MLGGLLHRLRPLRQGHLYVLPSISATPTSAALAITGRPGGANAYPVGGVGLLLLLLPFPLSSRTLLPLFRLILGFRKPPILPLVTAACAALVSGAPVLVAACLPNRCRLPSLRVRLPEVRWTSRGPRNRWRSRMCHLRRLLLRSSRLLGCGIQAVLVGHRHLPKSEAIASVRHRRHVRAGAAQRGVGPRDAQRRRARDAPGCGRAPSPSEEGAEWQLKHLSTP
mmetsp:Transcript_64170/g.184408  ORF Transcript_64170/g.184408 Transcript_64170/m.184408 type:complete len:224 (+) Transcript_64170:188-859(+)